MSQPGIITTPIGSANDQAFSVTVQADGKILVAGWTAVGSNTDFALVRYNVNGSLDTSFSGDGIATATIGLFDEGKSVTVQPDGKILVAGYSYNGHRTTTSRWCAPTPMARLDTSFAATA